MREKRPQSQSGLHRLFRPASIAVVGASANPTRIGGRSLRYLREFGYGGKVYAVNPRHEEVQGFPCYASVDALPEPVDIAALFVSSENVLDVVRAAARKRIGTVIVTASGFAEAGPEGKVLQDQLAEISRKSGLRVLGPNTLGYRDQRESVYATFATDIDSGIRKGRLAVITQSGGLGGYFGGALLRDHGVGLRYLVDTGNEVDIDVAECIEHLAFEPEVPAIGVILEGCRDGRRFLEACAEAHRQGKPVVVLKMGRTKAGAKAVQLHTGALAGEQVVWDAALAAAGAISARDEAQFFDLLCLLEAEPRITGGNVGVLTLSGGVATLLLDASSRLGLSVPPVTEPDSALEKSLPLASFHNPLDASGQMANTPEAIGPLLSFLLEQENLDLIVVWLAYALLSPQVGPVMAEAVRTAASQTSKPVIVLGLATPEIRDVLRTNAIPVFNYPTRLMEAVAALVSRRPPALPAASVWEGAASQGADRILAGPAARATLPSLPFAEYVPVSSPEEAEEAAQHVGFPMVIKVEAEGLAHKSDLGLVRTGLSSLAELRSAFREIVEAMGAHGISGGVVLQQQVDGVEAYAGYKVDPVFGPTVSIGLGGIFVEQMGDVVTLLAPITPDQALAALRRLKGFPILTESRGRAAADIEALSQVIAQLTRIASGIHTIAEVDLNPIMVRRSGEGAVAVDAVVRLRT